MPAKSAAITAQAIGIREKAKELAGLLCDVAREDLATRFIRVGEEIRQEAIAKRTAIDGDWPGD